MTDAIRRTGVLHDEDPSMPPTCFLLVYSEKFCEMFLDPDLCRYTRRFAIEARQIYIGVVGVNRTVDGTGGHLQGGVRDAC